MHKRRRCTMLKLLLVNDVHISKSAATSEKMWVMTRDSSHGQGSRGFSRRVATLDSLNHSFQASLRDANCFRLWDRGLKSAATFSASLRDAIGLIPPKAAKNVRIHDHLSQ